MNAHSSSSDTSPSLVCRGVRWWSARQDNGADGAAPSSGWASRHVAGCSHCQHYFAAVNQLQDGLREEAQIMASAVDQADVPIGLEDRIWTAVQPEVGRRSPSVRRSLGSPWFKLEFGVVAALVVAAVGWFSLGQPSLSWSDQTPVATVAEFDQADLQELAADLASLPQRVLASETSTTSTASAGALEAELAALGSDTRAVWQYLERSFLPTTRADAGASS